jgi:hypothetical protein
MSRIPPLEPRQAPWTARPLLAMARRMFGKNLTPLGVQARRPGILWFANLFGLAIQKSGLVSARLHALVNLRTAQTIGCPF